VRIVAVSLAFCVFLLSFCQALSAQTTQSTFLYLLEGRGVPNGTVHVFQVNSSTGALTESPGSPFSAGLVPKQLVVDPTGRFVYVTNSQSQDITGFTVDPFSGALTEMAGSPFAIGAQPVTSAADPSGRFFYVFATSNVNGVDMELLYEYTMDSATGFLTLTSSSPTTWEYGQGVLITSMAFNAAGNYAYLGRVAAGNLGAATLICSLDFISGALSITGSVMPGTTGQADNVSISPNGKFLYSINNTFSKADAFAVAPGGSSLAEISGSPYAVPYGPTSLFVHPSGNFLYITNSNTSYQAPSTGPTNGSIHAFSVASGSGALAQMAKSPIATGIDPLSIVVDPTGSFAYWTSSAPSGSSAPFAQIFGATIDPSAGALTPFSASLFSDSVASNGAQLAISYGPVPTVNPVPVITSLSPSSTNATGVAFTLQVNGVNFGPGSTVYFGGQLRNTAFVSPTQLNASILGSDIDNGGTAVVFVSNPLPGGGTSASVELPVSALAPNISVFQPTSIFAGSPFTDLFVGGSNFVVSSVVYFNGSPLPTTYVYPTLIYAGIVATQIVLPGSVSVFVTNPSNGVPGGGTSNTVTLTIVPPIIPLSVSSISPSSAKAGGPALFLTVNGTGFVQGSQVSFNLNNMATSFVSSTQLTALIPASAVATAGNPYVIVSNPGGSTSISLTFTINNPQPVGGTVTPQNLPAGSSKYTLIVSGSGFTPMSVILVNGGTRATTYVNPASLQATLVPADLAQSGTLDIAVMNPPPGGGTAPALGLTVAGYSLIAPAAESAITAGQTATFALTVSPLNGSFSNPVTLSVSSLPDGATATFAPLATITPGPAPQTVTLSIATTDRSKALLLYLPLRHPPVFLLTCAAGMAWALALFAFLYSGGRMQRLAPGFLIALLLLISASLAACSGIGSGMSSLPVANPATGTPPGTYSITVLATSGSASRSATVTLTVM